MYEHFIDFSEVRESTGKSLLHVLREKLEKLRLNLHDISGQSYDKGAIMNGNMSGVQACLLEMNPKALFSPCIYHR